MKIFSRIFLVIFLLLFFNITALFAEDLEKAPNFQLPGTHQEILSLADYAKLRQPVLLFFWTTWCPYCQKELGVLNNSYALLHKDGVKLLAIDSGEMVDKVRDFTSRMLLSYKVAVDADSNVTRDYDIIGVPTYVLVNKSGKIVFKDNYFPQDYKDLLSDKKSHG